MDVIARYTVEIIVGCEYLEWDSTDFLITQRALSYELHTETESDQDYLLAVF